MKHTFRIRVNRSSTCTLQTDLSQINLPAEAEHISLSLRASSPGKSIKDAERWVLVGEGYDSENDASAAGARFQDALMLTFAKLRVGVDFGDRSPKGSVTAYGQQLIEAQTGQPCLSDVHGLMTYSTDRQPLFVEFKANAVIGINIDAIEDRFVKSLKVQPTLRERDRLAISLFNASFFQPSADSRFLLLVMAIEALIAPKLKSEAAVGHVTRFMQEIEDSALPPHEKKSLIGSLIWLQVESINQAGKRLAREILGSTTYQDKPASNFFSDVYALRSNLVHGKLPFPTFNEICDVVGVLEVFVSDLLTAQLTTVS